MYLFIIIIYLFLFIGFYLFICIYLLAVRTHITRRDMLQYFVCAVSVWIFSFGLMEAQWRAPLKPSAPSQKYCIEGFKGALNWSPIMPRNASLSEYFFIVCQYFQCAVSVRILSTDASGKVLSEYIYVYIYIETYIYIYQTGMLESLYQNVCRGSKIIHTI